MPVSQQLSQSCRVRVSAEIFKLTVTFKKFTRFAMSGLDRQLQAVCGNFLLISRLIYFSNSSSSLRPKQVPIRNNLSLRYRLCRSSFSQTRTSTLMDSRSSPSTRQVHPKTRCLLIYCQSLVKFSSSELPWLTIACFCFNNIQMFHQWPVGFFGNKWKLFAFEHHLRQLAVSSKRLFVIGFVAATYLARSVSIYSQSPHASDKAVKRSLYKPTDSPRIPTAPP